jgi:hypothetical protein
MTDAPDTHQERERFWDAVERQELALLRDGRTRGSRRHRLAVRELRCDRLECHVGNLCRSQFPAITLLCAR